MGQQVPLKKLLSLVSRNQVALMEAVVFALQQHGPLAVLELAAPASLFFHSLFAIARIQPAFA